MYDFSTLSPPDFELIVRDLLAAEHGWALTAFGSGPDGGVDLQGTAGGSKIVVQCKHYAGSTAAQLRKALRDERPKMAAEKPDRYLVATSRLLTKTQHDAVRAEMTPLLNQSEDLLHRVDLNALLDAHPQVEDRHFKLWLASAAVLRRIVASGVWARSEALLEDVQSRVRLYVSHPGYQRAAKILAAQRVVVIAGSPGVGKSMLAEMLLLTHWREGWQVVQVGADIEEAWMAISEKGKQVFLYDDFLGQTDVGERLGKNEDARIAKFAHHVSTRTDKRFVLTTRTQVLKQAQQSREPLRRAAFDLRTCVVSLSDYDRPTKARILFNHLYFSGLARGVVREYSRSGAWAGVVDHANFSPRIVEQVLLRPHDDAEALGAELGDALDRPVELWGPSFEFGLSDLARELLLTLVTFRPDGVGRSRLLASCSIKASSLPTNQAFKALEGTWIRLTGSGPDLAVAFADPSCRDFVVAYLDQNGDEAVRILTATLGLEEALLLLRYAAPPADPGIPGRAGLADAIAVAGQDVLAHVAALYEAEAPSMSRFADHESALVTVMRVLPLLGEDAAVWLEAKLSGLLAREPQREYHAVDDLAELILFLGGREPDGSSRSALIADLSLALATEATLDEEFGAFDRIADDERTSPHLHPDAASTLSANVVGFIESELGEVTTQYQDPADMRERIDALAGLASDRGLLEEVRHTVDGAKSDVDGYDEYEPDRNDLSPSQAAEAFEPGPERPFSRPSTRLERRAAEDQQMRDLFEKLG